MVSQRNTCTIQSQKYQNINEQEILSHIDSIDKAYFGYTKTLLHSYVEQLIEIIDCANDRIKSGSLNTREPVIIESPWTIKENQINKIGQQIFTVLKRSTKYEELHFKKNDLTFFLKAWRRLFLENKELTWPIDERSPKYLGIICCMLSNLDYSQETAEFRMKAFDDWIVKYVKDIAPEISLTGDEDREFKKSTIKPKVAGTATEKGETDTRIEIVRKIFINALRTDKSENDIDIAAN